MNCSLSSHPDGYRINSSEVLFSIGTGMTALPLARRHWELSQGKTKDSKVHWGHRVVAVIQSLPVLGALAALIERIVVLIFNRSSDKNEQKILLKNAITVKKENNSSHQAKSPPPSLKIMPVPQLPLPNKVLTPPSSRPNSPRGAQKKVSNPLLPGAPKCSNWRPRQLNQDLSLVKMWKNSQKAILEARIAHSNSIISLEEGLPSLKSLAKDSEKPIQFAYFAPSEAQGKRKKMEDTYFFIEHSEHSFMTGVFDGHNGKEVAEYVKTEFSAKYKDILQASKGNIFYALEKAFDDIQKDILLKKEWDQIGSTAVVSLVDKKTHLIYTATVGDSEANIYRKTSEGMKSIPLSCVRDWSSKNDAIRAARFHDKPEIATEWPKVNNPKGLRCNVPEEGKGLNVSRSLGDKYCTGTEENPLVIHKPKITVNRLQSGDLLVLACDGLKDFVSEERIVEEVAAPERYIGKTVAQRLVNIALDEKIGNSRDNVTVLAVGIA